MKARLNEERDGGREEGREKGGKEIFSSHSINQIFSPCYCVSAIFSWKEFHFNNMSTFTKKSLNAILKKKGNRSLFMSFHIILGTSKSMSNMIWKMSV